MKYLKLFTNHNQYEDYVASGLTLPNVSHCIQEIEVHYNPIVPPDYSQEYLTFEALEDGTFKFTNPINYSTDGGTTWTELAANTNTPTITSGNKIMWKATLTPTSSSGIGKFSSTGNFNVEGNPMSLLFGDNFIGQTDLTSKNYAFYQLFYNCSKLINAKNLSLPATTLTNYCYSSMFNGCTNLTAAPTSIGNSVTTMTASACTYMFQGCTSLTTAPQLLATTLADSCYDDMFYGCTSLTDAPELPATTLAFYCYHGMFQGCTSLTTAPELLATTLATSCYASMFYGCTSLTTAPELPAAKLVSGCYGQMFNSCTNLNYIKAMFTTTPSSKYTQNWVYRVPSSGTFVKNSAAAWNVSGVHGVPTGWTVQTASA